MALLIDGQYSRKQRLIVTLGVDKQGQKHVLGLWHGATENSTLVRELLAGLRERRLNTKAAILVVLDGSKALYKGVREIFGQRALIQRCRVHKLRKMLDHLPLEKRQQAAWRLRGAWAKATPQEALKELRACVGWRDTDRKNELFQNPLLSHYPPTTSSEPPHYKRISIESSNFTRLSSTRCYAPNTNLLLTNYSFITRSLALSLALLYVIQKMIILLHSPR